MLVHKLKFVFSIPRCIRLKFYNLLIFFALIANTGLIISSTVNAEEVDLALVLAVDVSYSMDRDEQLLQRQGYISALTSPQVIAAIQRGRTGKIAVAYVEWAGSTSQFLIAGWHIIKDFTSAEQFSIILAQSPFQQIYRTSISEALNYSAKLFDILPYNTVRKTIDISGDGPNNQGSLVTVTRDQILARNISINGLPLLIKRPEDSWFDIPNLDEYYIKCVIGGPSSFSIPVHNVANFESALRKKLLFEIAEKLPPKNEIHLAKGFAITEINNEDLCTIGERMWQERMQYLDLE